MRRFSALSTCCADQAAPSLAACCASGRPRLLALESGACYALRWSLAPILQVIVVVSWRRKSPRVTHRGGISNLATEDPVARALVFWSSVQPPS